MPAIKPRFRQHGIRISDDQPFSQLNITPLIDVLLVLLVMLMLSIPGALHKVEIDLPGEGTGFGNPVIHNLKLGASGTASWNGTPVDDKQLHEKLQTMAKNPAKPQLYFETDGRARYERFDQLAALIKRSGVREVGFIGNKQFANWDKTQ